jgi:hypothetical protein
MCSSYAVIFQTFETKYAPFGMLGKPEVSFASSIGTRNPVKSGPLASCRAGNAVAPRHPARENIQFTGQTDRLGGPPP